MEKNDLNAASNSSASSSKPPTMLPKNMGTKTKTALASPAVGSAELPVINMTPLGNSSTVPSLSLTPQLDEDEDYIDDTEGGEYFLDIDDSGNNLVVEAGGLDLHVAEVTITDDSDMTEPINHL